MNAQKIARIAVNDPLWVRYGLMGLTIVFIFLFLVLPLLTIFVEAFAKGWTSYADELSEYNNNAAVKLTLLVALICVPLTTVFGVASAWAIARFEFPGKSFLTTLIDLPFSVSPVTAGLIFVLMFGAQGWFGEWLQAHNIKIIFAVLELYWQPCLLPVLLWRVS